MAKAIIKFETPELYAERIGTPLEEMEISKVLGLTVSDWKRLWNARLTCPNIPDLEICINRYIGTPAKRPYHRRNTEQPGPAQRPAKVVMNGLTLDTEQKPWPGFVIASAMTPDQIMNSADEAGNADTDSDEPLTLTPPKPTDSPNQVTDEEESEERPPYVADATEQTAAAKLAEMIAYYPTILDYEQKTGENVLNARPVEILEFNRTDLAELWSHRKSGREKMETVDPDGIRNAIKAKLLARENAQQVEAFNRCRVEDDGKTKAVEGLTDIICRFSSLADYQSKADIMNCPLIHELGFEYLDVERIWKKRGLYVFDRAEIQKAIESKYAEKARDKDETEKAAAFEKTEDAKREADCQAYAASQAASQGDTASNSTPHEPVDETVSADEPAPVETPPEQWKLARARVEAAESLWRNELFFAWRIARNCSMFSDYLARQDGDNVPDIPAEAWKYARDFELSTGPKNEADCLRDFIKIILRKRIEGLEAEIRRAQVYRAFWIDQLLIENRESR